MFKNSKTLPTFASEIALRWKTNQKCLQYERQPRDITPKSIYNQSLACKARKAQLKLNRVLLSLEFKAQHSS